MAGVINTHTFGNRGPGHFCIGVNDPIKSNEHITIAANSGDLEAGTVLGEITATPGTYAPLDPADTVPGTAAFGCILYQDVPDSTSTQRATGVVRDQPVNGNALKYENALNQAQLDAMVAEAEAERVIVRY